MAKSFGVSGWSDEEMKRLNAMVAEDVTDRSRFLRRLAQKEWVERERKRRILEAVRTPTRRKGEGTTRKEAA